MLPLRLLFLFSACASASSLTFVPIEDEERGRWSFDFGVAWITGQNLEQLLGGELDFDDGPAGGEIYSFTASRLLGELHWQCGDTVFRPQLELPLTLEVVDENGRAPFPDFNASLLFRWVDFPWNDRLPTSLGFGVGLSYSTRVYAMDIQRHQGDHRSRLKFNMPVQLTFALPSRPQDQLMLYLAHQSGGRIFDRGGVNSLGIGYRRGF